MFHRKADSSILRSMPSLPKAKYSHSCGCCVRASRRAAPRCASASLRCDPSCSAGIVIPIPVLNYHAFVPTSVFTPIFGVYIAEFAWRMSALQVARTGSWLRSRLMFPCVQCHPDIYQHASRCKAIPGAEPRNTANEPLIRTFSANIWASCWVVIWVDW